MASKSIKVTAVGDGTVGKTSLLISYTTNTFPQDYSPTVFDSYETDVDVNSIKVHLLLTDTAGQEDYNQLRPLSYNGTDVFVLCFSVANHPSMENVTQRWMPEINQHAKGVPVVLVATKTDLRAESHVPLISEPEGRALAIKIGAAAYVECSAKTQVGLDGLFIAATRAALSPKSGARRSPCGCCSIV